MTKGPGLARSYSAIGLALFLALLFFYALDRGRPPQFMEYYYLESAREMFARGDWLTPTFNGRPRFDKPILLYWLVMLSTGEFGLNWWAARFPSVLAALGLLGLTYCLGRELWGREEAWLAVVILATIPLFVLFARQAIPDMTLTFGITLGLYAFWKAAKDPTGRRRWWWLCYVGLALAILAKGPVGIAIPGLVILAFAVATRDTALLRRARPVEGLAILLVIVLPWFLYMYRVHGPAYVNYIQGILSEAAAGHQRHSWFFYLEHFFFEFLPWSPILVSAGLAALRRPRPTWAKSDPAILFCLMGFLIPLVFFSFMSLKAPRYLLPATPAFSLLTAYVLVRVLKEAPDGLAVRGLRILTWAVAVMAVVFAVAGWITTYALRDVFPIPPSAWAAVRIGLILFGLSGAILVRALLKRPTADLPMGIAGVVGAGLLGFFVITVAASSPSALSRLGSRILAERHPGDCIAVYRLEVNDLVWTVGPPVIQFQRPEDLKMFCPKTGLAFVVARQSDIPKLAQAADGDLRILAQEKEWKRLRGIRELARFVRSPDQFQETLVLLSLTWSS